MSAVKKRSQLAAKPIAASTEYVDNIKALETELAEAKKELARLNLVKDPLSGAVADKIVEKLADKTADGVVKHIISKLLKTLELVPAARDVAVRFKTREMLWVDEEATRTHVLETWRKHMKETLKVSIEELDDVYVVSLVVPEVRVSAKQNKSNAKSKILIDADHEV